MTILNVGPDNWRDGVHILELDNTLSAKSKFFNPSQCKHWLTEAELIAELDSIFYEFPAEPFQDRIELYDGSIVKINRKWKDSYYFMGDCLYNSPVTVLKYEDRYSPMIHPKSFWFGFCSVLVP